MGESSVLDLKQIEKLKEWGGTSLQKKMIELFLAHAGDRLAQIREGLAAGDALAAETGAHTLKSSAGNVGAHRLQYLALEAEQLAEASRLDDLEALLPRLEEAFVTASEALRSLMEGIGE